eukprot:CAMPEP_0194365098 /NCGR_PEP_ID=MMETSP0174-20130528/13079_1 /TAXON_ID=216777 /ORGANISM="Proboscia alata, Strain PI-D3" /LENGTH=444 /DNA_ID=CAMNT_0039139557 /DNA_START=72 /DNA_END=1406 /DNA_ORIENTATION=-
MLSNQISEANALSKIEDPVNRSCILPSVAMVISQLRHVSKNDRAKNTDFETKTLAIDQNRRTTATPKRLGSQVWIVPGKTENLPDVPLCVERKCSIQIANTNPSTIAKRIKYCLQRISAVVSKYSKDKQDVKAKVTNIDQVIYVIKLYRVLRMNAEVETENYDVMVEVQRRQGDALSFCRDCKTILHATRFNNHTQEDFGSFELCAQNMFLTPTIPSSFSYKHSDVVIENSKTIHQSCLNSFRDIELMLKEENMLGEILLGMECLRCLTDPSFSLKMAVAAADIIPQVIIERVRDVLLKTRIGSYRNYGVNGDDGGRRTSLKEDIHTEILVHHQAICCLCNILSVVNPSSLQKNSMLVSICNDLIPTLLNDLRRASSAPHIAYFSCKCLSAMLRMNNHAYCSVREQLLKLGALTVIGKTQHIGKCQHALLEEESGLVFSALLVQ